MDRSSPTPPRPSTVAPVASLAALAGAAATSPRRGGVSPATSVGWARVPHDGLRPDTEHRYEVRFHHRPGARIGGGTRATGAGDTGATEGTAATERFRTAPAAHVLAAVTLVRGGAVAGRPASNEGLSTP